MSEKVWRGDLARTGLTRRDVLRGAALFGAGAALGPFVAARGSSAGGGTLHPVYWWEPQWMWLG